jgi:retron-type reverse transcriptase
MKTVMKEGKKRKYKYMKILNIKYKNLLDIELYKEAYQRIKSNPGNMTPGVDRVTLDGVSLGWLEGTIRELKRRSFQFKPSKRIYIPKTNGKIRPLGIPTPRDKIIQKGIAMLLEKEFETVFLNSSHGFRPKRSCHTALMDVRKWQRTTWMIEGDIKTYFDSINHTILANILQEYIKDQNILDIY